MANANESRPMAELLSGLVGDITSLFRKEINLAKAEASEKMSHAIGGAELVLVGTVFAIGAIGVLLAALVHGISAFLVTRGMTEPGADALAAVIVGVVVAIIAWVLISRGLSAIRGTNLSLERTTTSIRRDAEVVKGRIS
jgi:hypothetical protein